MDGALDGERHGRAAPCNERQEFEAAPFFVLRTPFLPVDAFLMWGATLQAPGARSSGEREVALQRDLRDLREYLETIIDRPDVQEALLLASEDLLAALPAWRAHPDSRKGRRAEQALVRYFTRMTTRTAPFGLFSGWTIGRVGGRSQLRLAGIDEYRLHSELDVSYVRALAFRLASRDQLLAGQIRYFPNETLYESHGSLHYAVAAGEDSQAAELHAVDRTPPVLAVISAAQGGARIAELARAVRQTDASIQEEDARAFVLSVVNAGIVRSELVPPVTGPGPLLALLAAIDGCESWGAMTVKRVAVLLREIDRAGIGLRQAGYEALRETLRPLSPPPSVDRLVRVNLAKPGAIVTLGSEVVDEVRSACRVVARVAEPSRGIATALARLRSELEARYDRRPVRLVDVFDADTGVAWSRRDEAVVPPLLDGLRFGSSVTKTATSTERPIPRILAHKLNKARASGAEEVVLLAEDIGDGPRAALPDSFEVVFRLTSASQDAIQAGRFRLILDAISGPPGGRLLGRLCRNDDDLARLTLELVRAEESIRPDVTFAEIVHSPAGAAGNVVLRPLLRRHEIPYLGVSGVPADDQILVADLWLCVSDDRIILFSERLGREVVPRLASAHVPDTPIHPPVYRFLGLLAMHGGPSFLPWEDEQAEFTPRVVTGRTVLSPATWRLEGACIANLAAAREPREQYEAAQQMRVRHRLPRYVAFMEFENHLIVDLDNPLSIGAVVPLLRGRTRVVFREWLSGWNCGAVSGPEGHYAHDIILPFLRTSQRESSGLGIAKRIQAAIASGHGRKVFHPGSEWLALKLYSGPHSVDRILIEFVKPILDAAEASGVIDRWFFTRYGDPEWHVRVRVRGVPGELLTQVLRPLQSRIDEDAAGTRIWRLQVDTYDPEAERYGGAAGLDLAERLFHVDSVAVVRMLESTPAAERARQRWRLALLGTDMLLDDVGLCLRQKMEVIARQRRSLWAQLDCERGLEQQLSKRYRRERASLEELVFDQPRRLEGAEDHLEARSRGFRQLASELPTLVRAGRVLSTVEDVSASYIHMFANRILDVGQNAQELVICDFLARLYASHAARAGIAGLSKIR